MIPIKPEEMTNDELADALFTDLDGDNGQEVLREAAKRLRDSGEKRPPKGARVELNLGQISDAAED